MTNQNVGGTYLQCCNCGKIYKTYEYVDIESIYIDSYCPCCEHFFALNCGTNKNDIYNLYNFNLDERFFIYNK